MLSLMLSIFFSTALCNFDIQDKQGKKENIWCKVKVQNNAILECFTVYRQAMLLS